MRYSRLNRTMRRFICALSLLLLWEAGAIQAQELRQYSIRISFPKGGSISGLCIIRMEGDGGVMSVVNEFGIKAFDAIYTKKRDKVKLRNVIAPLDRWYIRKGIAKDMSLLFNPERKSVRNRVLVREADSSITLTNRRFKITYHLRPIENVTE